MTLGLYGIPFAVLTLAAIALFAWGLSYVFSFYRKALEVEDRTRLTPLDGLRGVLCFAVMISHAAITHNYVLGSAWNFTHNRFFDMLGELSVGMFFSTTAYLFWSRALARAGEIRPVGFLRARLMRIGPMYVVSCLLIEAALAPYVTWTWPLAWSFMGIFWMGMRQWTAFGVADAFTAGSGVTWTLQYEWGFYLLLPCLAGLATRNPWKLWLLFGGGLVLFGYTPALNFAPGVLAAYAVRRSAVASRLRQWPSALLVLAVPVVYPLVTSSGNGLLPVVLNACAFVPIACGNSVFGVLNFRGLRLMGLVSYSVYLTHSMFLYLARPTLVFASRSDAAFNFWRNIAVCGAATLLMSVLTFRWVEWPFMAWERRLREAPLTEDLVRGTVPAVAV